MGIYDVSASVREPVDKNAQLGLSSSAWSVTWFQCSTDLQGNWIDPQTLHCLALKVPAAHTTRGVHRAWVVHLHVQSATALGGCKREGGGMDGKRNGVGGLRTPRQGTARSLRFCRNAQSWHRQAGAWQRRKWGCRWRGCWGRERGLFSKPTWALDARSGDVQCQKEYAGLTGEQCLHYRCEVCP